MTQLKTAILDAAIELGLDIERLNANLERNVLSTIRELQRDLLVFANTNNLQTRTQLAEAIKQASEEIEAAYETLYATTSAATLEIAAAAVASSATSINISLGDLYQIRQPTRNQLEAINKQFIVDGTPHKKYWDRQSDSVKRRFESIIRRGMSDQMSNADIANDVRDAMQIEARNATALTRTATNAIASEAQMQMFENNQDIIKSVEWSATLDARTCIKCGSRDGKRWSLQDRKPINHGISFSKPPIHFNDRCRLIPITKSFSELGVDLPEIRTETRASDIGYTNDKTFKQFLERKDKDYQDSALGKGRAELWRSGKITFNQLVDGRGNPLTLEELKEKYL